MNDTTLSKTVSDYIFDTASRSLLTELASESEYWASVDKFVEEQKSAALQNLSYKQRDWLVKIKIGLLEIADERG